MILFLLVDVVSVVVVTDVVVTAKIKIIRWFIK